MAKFTQSKALHQLLFHLREIPEELATSLGAIITNDATGKSADALCSLFVQKATTGPSASTFFGLFNHWEVGYLVEPFALLARTSQMLC